jgi:hypothetical protein
VLPVDIRWIRSGGLLGSPERLISAVPTLREGYGEGRGSDLHRAGDPLRVFGGTGSVWPDLLDRYECNHDAQDTLVSGARILRSFVDWGTGSGRDSCRCWKGLRISACGMKWTREDWQRSCFGERRSEVGGRRSEVGGRRSEVGGRRSEVIGSAMRLNPASLRYAVMNE